MASHITCNSTVQRLVNDSNKTHTKSVLKSFRRGIHGWLLNSHQKRSITWKTFVPLRHHMMWVLHHHGRYACLYIWSGSKPLTRLVFRDFLILAWVCKSFYGLDDHWSMIRLFDTKPLFDKCWHWIDFIGILVNQFQPNQTTSPS